MASLDRLLASDSIARAPRLRAILRFMLDALQEGQAAGLNEQVIGQAVFNRPAGYNTGEDNIVRVTIRHLRERIAEYYRTEGRDERYVLVIPKGNYVPSVLPRVAEELVLSDADGLAAMETAEPAAIAKLEKRAEWTSARLFAWLPWMLVVALLAVVAVLVEQHVHHATATTFSRDRMLLSPLLGNGKQVTVVVTDANLQAYRAIFRKTVSLDAYLARSYMPDPNALKDPATSGAWEYITTAPRTGVSSSIVAAEIQAAAMPAMIRIKHPRELSMRDFQHDNFILLGGPWSDPWGHLYEGRLNFRFPPVRDNPTGSQIHNTNPLPNESQDYIPHRRDNNLSVNYARIALLRNFSNDGYIILLGATSEESLEAAGRFILNPQQVQGLLKSFNVSTLEELPSLELVIEVEGLQSVPEDVHIVAEREVKPR